jgi:hypothetical protein
LIVVLLGGAAVVFAAARITESPAFIPPKDFPEYWAAGRLNLRGEDPYDASRVLAEQQMLEPDRREPVMMWNPPPSLALYMPLGLLPYRLSGLVWVGVQLLATLVACDLLWRLFHPQRRRWIAFLLAVSFVGTWWMASFGQNSGLLLLGLAGFAHFTQRGKPLCAGAAAALTAIKPHLFAGFALLLLVDVCRQRGRWTLVGGALAIAGALGLALAANPLLLEEYVSATRHPAPGATPLSSWVVLMPAYWLRMAVAPQAFWVQFAPCMLGCVALLAWRLIRGARWDWPMALPLAATVCIITAPYGWIFDLTILLIPLLWAASRVANARQWAILAVMLAGEAAVTAVSLAKAGALGNDWWVPPAVLLLCIPGVIVGRGTLPMFSRRCSLSEPTPLQSASALWRDRLA